MSEQDKPINSKAVPFFARYLEEQLEDLSEEEMKAIGGGKGLIMTKKYPSDQEEGGEITDKLSDVAVTLKYPSDQEDSGGVTEKYPSDSDEWAVTMKYPSDGDDDIQSIEIIS
jgi:hypothetical protein